MCVFTSIGIVNQENRSNRQTDREKHEKQQAMHDVDASINESEVLSDSADTIDLSFPFPRKRQT